MTRGRAPDERFITGRAVRHHPPANDVNVTTETLPLPDSHETSEAVSGGRWRLSPSRDQVGPCVRGSRSRQAIVYKLPHTG